ncbi:MAG: C39 family peptidase, partial [Candidatus Cloacimonetes bacterium]|nr:C39 family peptidase [Candidatus Cloacimonadota bacterium]
MWIKNFKQLFLFWLIMIMIFSINLLSAQQKIDKKFIVRTFIDENGKSIDEIIVPGRPPVDYREPAVVLPDPNTSETINVLTNVPAFDWSYGCSATSAAMMAGYYDNTIHPEMYTGPTNNGVVPMNNSSWGTGECPLSATHQGYDGLSSRGHVDDYWISYGSTASDPYITGGWTPHTNADCTADFMGTNQSAFGNTDGATTFYNYTDGSILYDYTGCEPGQKDGTHGLREFFESRGYAIQYNSGNYQNYSQYIMGYSGNTLGFTFDQYKAEIDAGRPVLIQVEGHTMLGLGYDDSTNLVYIHDTWDHSNHTMTWGGSYSGMAHYAVGVFILEDPSITVTSPNGGEIWGLGTTQNITWTSQYVSNIDIDLYNSGSFVMSIAADVSSSLGSFPWFVPTGLPLNSQYSIKISDSDASSNDDYSDGYFTINNFSALIDVTPITLSTTLEPDEQDTQQIHITNIGAPGSILNYSLSHSFTDTDNISGSYIVCSSANYTPGATTNWTFSVYNASTDSEWITDIYITLPDGVTVNSGSDFIGGFYPLIYDGSTGNGVTIHWYDGDGGWGNIYEGETASSTINVSISPSLTGNLTLDYQIDGDTYGGEPHTISDSMLILHETWLSYNPSNGSCAQGETDDIDVTLDATDLPLGTYTADLLITNDGGGPVVIPVTMNIVDPPDIEISTDSFSEDLYTDETSIQLLIVNNVGGEQLDFTATLDPVVSWLELNPDNGSVDPYTGTIAVDVDFNSSSLTTGTYNTNIVINSNDPVEPEITISVSLVVHNSAPTIILPDEFTFTEDGSLIVDFSAYIDDVDPDDLTLMVTGNIEVVVDITGTVVT